MGDIETVAVTDLPDDFTGDGDRILLDVREDDEWAQAHIRGALHIPLADVPARVEEIDLDRELLVVCRTSGRSYRIMEYLLMRGIDGAVVTGGMVAWQNAGKPVVTGSADA
ncbi:rhodanese-like domain-containing protein [Gordonia sp. (in: high G+C Gram-positive bacteria)]|uniref:rhodanese-like domain-containing protein n=1 Tax=Gordonia sp. (in: high G+C Gram-positive bacteria) TaxID=84139 RepID=UPI003F992D65